MRNLLTTCFFSMTAFLSSAVCEENSSIHLQNAQKGFQDRWQEFQSNFDTFPLWSADWTEDELKSRFDQMVSMRLQVYFTNFSEGSSKNYIQGQYRSSFALPDTFESWGSRFSSPGSFSYNLASSNYNASIITLNGKQFLAMEAPTSKNFETFFFVLSQYHVTDLVRLTAAIDNTQESSFPYWEGHLDINPKNGRSTIEFADIKANYYFTDLWKNQDGIEPKRLIALIKAVENSENENKIIAVHCKAGVGRTGTFLAAYTLINEIDFQIANGTDIDHVQISIDQVFWEISLQRPFGIARYSQYLTLYQVVNEYIESIKTANSASTTS